MFQFWYVVYLILYAIVLLCDYEPGKMWPGRIVINPHTNHTAFERDWGQKRELTREILLYIWQFTIAVEIARQVGSFVWYIQLIYIEGVPT